MLFRIVQPLVAGTLVALALSGRGAIAADATVAPSLSVEQIIDRYVAARGGAPAWQKVQTMAWTGHVESGPDGATKSPFLMMFKRPEATRFELLMQGQRLIRSFDGATGWKQQPTSSGVPEVKHYSAEELRYAHGAGGLDGPLMDYRSKGVTVVLQGEESIEGHEAYRLGVTLPSGQTRTDWIDAQSFLELKYDRETRNPAGQSGTVSVHYRDYHTVNGLVMPFTIETGSARGSDTDRMIIEKIAINPALGQETFSEPATATPGQHRKGALIDTTAAPR